MSDDVHEIYAIKYGRHERRKAENYIGGDPHDVNDPLDFYVWAIVGPIGTIVVDTGFDAAMAKKRGRVISRPIAEGLTAVGVAPESVKNVIISHLHYDHCGNYDLFPQARYHLQDREMALAPRHPRRFHVRLEGVEIYDALETAVADLRELDRADVDAAARARPQARRGVVSAAAALRQRYWAAARFLSYVAAP